MGPLLWNAAYDRVLRIQLPQGTRLLGFADDTLVIASGRTSEETQEAVNVASEIRGLGLELAVEKTHAVMFKRKYKDRVPRITLDGVEVYVGQSIKYLGITVDDRLGFKKHVQMAADKASKAVSALARIMPNIGGPKEPRRRLLLSVVHSVVLYGAPVWAESLLYTKKSAEALLRVQRRAALLNVCAYRTVSYNHHHSSYPAC